MSLENTLDLAAQWHRDQKRKGVGKELFVLHPLRVAGILIGHGLQQEALLSAALLHDILEDTDCPEEEIINAAHPSVLAWVKELTDDKHLLKRERKQHQVERADVLSPEAKLIRLADKIDNVESLLRDPPTGWSWQRKREYIAWANRVVKALGPVHPSMQRHYQDVQHRASRVCRGKDIESHTLP